MKSTQASGLSSPGGVPKFTPLPAISRPQQLYGETLHVILSVRLVRTSPQKPSCESSRPSYRSPWPDWPITGSQTLPALCTPVCVKTFWFMKSILMIPSTGSASNSPTSSLASFWINNNLYFCCFRFVTSFMCGMKERLWWWTCSIRTPVLFKVFDGRCF